MKLSELLLKDSLSSGEKTMKKTILSVLITALVMVIIFALFITSFILGGTDGCRDAGYDTFAVGKYGLYCFNQSSFEPVEEPIYTERDL